MTKLRELMQRRPAPGHAHDHPAGPRLHRPRGRRLVGMSAVVLLGAALAATPAAAAGTPSPGSSSGSGTSGDAKDVVPGTTFLAAVPLGQNETVRASSTTGEYLYWQYPAAAGQQVSTTVNLTLPPSAGRTAPSTWRVDLFDGLRRHQPCISGNQQAIAQVSDRQITLRCTAPTVHGWAEPWSADALPGTYFLRVAAIGIADVDAGQAFTVEVNSRTHDGGDAGARTDDRLADPLVPVVNAGTTLQPGATVPTHRVDWAQNPHDDGGWFDWQWTHGVGGRWLWTGIGGVVAALTGLIGYRITHRPRRWFGWLR